jgi:hypothetical protein
LALYEGVPREDEDDKEEYASPYAMDAILRAMDASMVPVALTAQHEPQSP